MNLMKLLPDSCALLLAIGIALAAPASAGDVRAIQRANTLPATTPWNLDALSQPPEFEWGEGEEVRSMFYKGEPYQSKPTRVFAYYATPGSLAGDPSLDKDLPGIVLVHGGGGTAFPHWAKLWASRGYAAIAMDLGIRGPADEKFLSDGGPSQKDGVKFATGQPATDMWTYHAVADVIRAHSLLLAFDEVDPDRTALTGISWGGYLTCIVAGLDNRFQAAAPVYGCGFLHENSVWRGTLQSMAPEDRDTWVRLWDPSMYVGSATMPMLFANGGTDFAYPPDSHARTYALVTSSKNLHFVPNLPHGHKFGIPHALEVFIDHQLKEGTPLPAIGPVEVGGEQLVAPVTTSTKLLKAELHFTVEDLRGAAKGRKWVTKPASLSDDSITAEHPPAEATAWFLTLTDERNTTVSSSLVFPGSEPDRVAEVRADHELSRIAFGSCLRNPSGARILEKVVAYEPDLFVWLGDNIYVDTMDQVERFGKLYGQLGGNPRFQELRKTCPQLAIWDDHDYGADNHDRTYPLKRESKAAFGEFWKVPEASAFWGREGIYRAVEFGEPGRRVQMILLDGRWFLDKQDRDAGDSYLGREQWAWLEEVLKRPAEVRVICSGVQVIKLNDMGKNWEMWGHHPTERKRLFDLIDSTRANGVVFVSGDMHFAELYKTRDTSYPLHDLTASGLDQVHPQSGKVQPDHSSSPSTSGGW